MLASANSKLLLALLGIAILLFNPAGFCTDDMSAKAGHPCCPKAPVAAKSPCLCIDRHPAAPTVGAPAESGAIAAVMVDVPLPLLLAADSTSEAAVFNPPDRSIVFHQLLV